MNKTLDLAVGDVGSWPSTLHECGYRVHAIERSVRVEGRTVVPDIIFLNEAGAHMLVVDCKGGANIKREQDARYSRMRLADMLEAARPPCEVRSHTFAYAVNEEHAGRMREHTDFAMITFGSHAVRAIGNLGHGRLTADLQGGVSLGKSPAPPFYDYPFSINDDHGYIDSRVAPAVEMWSRERRGARLLANRATAGEMLRMVHPFHGRFAPAHRAELVDVVRLSIGRILARRRPRWF